MEYLELAKKNKAAHPEEFERLRKKTVVKMAREQGIDLNEELKIHRDAIILLLEIVQKLHGEEIKAERLLALNTLFEGIKEQVRKEFME